MPAGKPWDQPSVSWTVFITCFYSLSDPSDLGYCQGEKHEEGVWINKEKDEQK